MIGDGIRVSNVQDLTRDSELGDTFMTFVNNQGAIALQNMPTGTQGT